MRKVIKIIFQPLLEEMPFFISAFFLLTPRTLYSAFKNMQELFNVWGQFPVMRFFSIAIVFSYCLSVIIYIINKVNPRVSHVVKIAFYSILYILFSVNLFLAVNFKAAISTNTLQLLFETNPDEVKGFVSTFFISWRSTLVYIIVLFLLFLNYQFEKKGRSFLILKGKQLTMTARKLLVVTFLLVIAAGAYSIRIYPSLFRCKTVEEIGGWNKGGDPYMDTITACVYSFCDLQLMGETLKRAVSITESIDPKEQKYLWGNDTSNVILVIGESFIKSHSSLYGYALPTNPRLQREKDKGRLLIFSNVVSPFSITSTVIRNMLSCNSIGDGEKWYEYPFMPAIFKQAGFNVYIWDNQYKKMSNANFDFHLNAYVHNKVFSKSIYEAEREQVSLLDDELIADFQRKVKHFTRSNKNLFVFHLQGQHFSQKERYPNRKEFQLFSIGDIRRNEAWMTNGKRQEIAHYDNSIHYNDSVISHIISLFSNTYTVMIYLSDHGDDIYDTGDSKGRQMNLTSKDGKMIRQLTEIPFFVWYSDKYKATHSDIVQALCSSQHKPMMSDNICHMLFQIGGLKSEYYKENRNVISKEYVCPPRIVNDSINYDQLQK